MDTKRNQLFLEKLDIACIDRHLRVLCQEEKLSGEPEALRAAEYIKSALEEMEIPCKMLTFDAYLSNPLDSSLTVQGKEYASRPRSFSGNCEALEAELVYDAYTSDPSATELQKEQFYQTVGGKVVLGHGFDERYGKILEMHGAAGWIQIWQSDEQLIHEDTVSPVWGTPDMDSRFLLLRMPVVGVTRETGEALIKKVQEQAGGVTARLSVHATHQVKEVALPVATLKGASEDFVLLSCHYDTWYIGAFDNCAANASALEIARVLKEMQGDLKRSVRIAWWPGHSNGRYMGSTWYCDNYFAELKGHCIASVNSDLIGAPGTDVMGVKTTQAEGQAFLEAVLAEAAPGWRLKFQTIGRGADQSFFGADIPYHINPRLETEVRRFATPGPGGDFWHTAEDTYDKIDLERLKLDASFLGLITYVMASAKELPLDCENYFGLWRGRLQAVQEQAGAEFDLAPVQNALTQAETAVRAALENAGTEAKRDRVIKMAFGTMNRLFQSSGSAYEQDTAFAYGPFHLLAESTRIKKEESPAEQYLFYRTTFIRQRNRMVAELEELSRRIGSSI